MSKHQTPYQYTAADFALYYSGKMSREDMHALEKAALDDPFLSEAMEGYAHYQQEDWENALLNLTSQLNNTPPTTKIVPFKQTISYQWWRVAAAVLILVSCIGITYWMTGNKKEVPSNLATVQTLPKAPEKTAESKSLPDSASPVTIQGNTQNNSSNPSTAKTELKSNNSGYSVDSSINSATSNGNVAFKEVLAETTPTLSKDRNDKSVATNQDYKVKNEAPVFRDEQISSKSFDKITTAQSPSSVAMNSVKVQQKELEVNKQSKQTISNKVFTGFVVSSSHQPIPYAHVKILNKHSNSYANKYGTIHLPVEDSVLEVEFSAVGYNTMKTKININNGHNEFVLNNHSNDQRDIAVERSEKRKLITNVNSSAKKLNSQQATAFPSDGWFLYNTYLENNKTLPPGQTRYNVPPSVTLEFDVDNEGDISNVKVIRSTCPDCDAEAIRLLQEGPDWEIDHGLKGKGTLEIRF